MFFGNKEFEEDEFYNLVARDLMLKLKLKDTNSLIREIYKLTRHLIDVGLIERSEKGLKIKEELVNFFTFLKKNFRRNTTRLVAWAVWYVYNQKGNRFELSAILQFLPTFIRENVIRILKRLHAEVSSDENVNLNELTILKVIDLLKGKISDYWPFFGTFYVKNTKFFKILRGQSCTAYVDVPNSIYEELIKEIVEIDRRTLTPDEFFTQALKVVKYFNEKVLSEFLNEAVGASIDWLSYKLEERIFLKKDYGLRMQINWKKFLDFIEEYAKSDVELWKKYRYLSHCRISATTLAKRQHDFKRTIEMVKTVAKDDMESIKGLLDELAKKIEIAKNNLIKFERTIYRKFGIEVQFLTSIYLFEMESIIKAVKSFVDQGIPSAWYREARSIVENLAWSIFEDLLTFRTLEVGFYPARFYFDVAMEWMQKVSRKGLRHPSNFESGKEKIRNNFLRGLKTIKHERELKDRITNEILKNMSYPLFIALFGVDASKVSDETYIPSVSRSDIIKPAQENLKAILNKLNVGDETVKEFIDKLSSTVPAKVVPPLPPHRFILEFVDDLLSTKFYELWSSYSFFVHSNFTSWHVVPFTSVLEFKILKNELIKFSNEVEKAFKVLTKIFRKRPLNEK